MAVLVVMLATVLYVPEDQLLVGAHLQHAPMLSGCASFHVDAYMFVGVGLLLVRVIVIHDVLRKCAVVVLTDLVWQDRKPT